MNPQVLILLPGLLCDEAVWAAQRRALAHLNCFIPSYGARSSITEMAQRVLAQAPAERFRLAGHSMGGRVALEIARLAPDRVGGLALLDTGVDVRPEGAAGQAELDKRMELLQIARQRGMRAMGMQWVPGMVHPARLATPLFEEIVAMVERKSVETFEAQILALLNRPDARPVLQSLACPTVLICGRQDAWSPLSRHEQMRDIRPQSRLVVIEDSGHMTTMEQPQAVTAALREWLAITAQ